MDISSKLGLCKTLEGLWGSKLQLEGAMPGGLGGPPWLWGSDPAALGRASCSCTGRETQAGSLVPRGWHWGR